MKKFTVIIICFGFLAANATSWRVNNNPAIDADFSDITTAIDAASEGDTLYIEGTQYNYGDVILDKPLVLIGPGYFLLENDSTQANQIAATLENFNMDPGSSGSSVFGLSFTKHITINANDVVFARNKASDNTNYDLRLGTSNDIINVVVTQNYLRELNGATLDNGNGILISNNYVEGRIELSTTKSATVFNNVVGYKIQVHNSVVKNNITYGGNNGGISGTNNIYEYNILNYNGGVTPPGTGNIIGIDPNEVFVDYDGSLGYSTDGKWQLKEGSIAIGYGENGVDCGIFGGTSPYILSGLAPVPHIYEAIVPVSGSTASGLPVTIKVKSQN